MALSPQWLDELKSRITLSALIQRTVKLTRAGREWKACCPFHSENTPSFYVNDQKGFYPCFGCGAHGSAVDFVMATENLSFPEAVERLAAREVERFQDLKRRNAKLLYNIEKQARRSDGKVAFRSTGRDGGLEIQ